jgi:hypothetical protein
MIPLLYTIRSIFARGERKKRIRQMHFVGFFFMLIATANDLSRALLGANAATDALGLVDRRDEIGHRDSTHGTVLLADLARDTAVVALLSCDRTRLDRMAFHTVFTRHGNQLDDMLRAQYLTRAASDT